jgi:hypothetical protein
MNYPFQPGINSATLPFFKKEDFPLLLCSIILTNLLEKGKILQIMEVFTVDYSLLFLSENNSFRMNFFLIQKTNNKIHKKFKHKNKKKNWLDAC